MDPTTRERELLEKLRGREHTIESFGSGAAAVLRAATADESSDDRTVAMACSSEREVERWFGFEILDHSPAAVRLDRLRAHGPLLSEHWGPQVGRATKVWLKDRTLRAECRFGNSPLAETEFQDVRDQIRTGVSIRYLIHAIRLEEVRDGDVEVYRVTDWEPTHIALVAEPADTTVGVGRSLDGARRAGREEPMNIEKLSRRDRARAGDQEIVDGGLSREDLENREQIRTVAAKFRGRIDGIEAGEAHALEQGWSYERFSDWVMEKLGERSMAQSQPRTVPGRVHSGAMPGSSTEDPGFLDLSNQDRERFNLLRAVSALWNGRLREDAPYEYELNRTLEDRLKRSAGRDGNPGLLVPKDFLVGSRAAVTKAGGGAGMVGVDHGSEGFIDRLREATQIYAAGARVTTGLVGDLDLPRLLTGATAVWVDEDEAGTYSAPTTDKVQMTPHLVIALVEITNKMIRQSDPSVSAIFEADMAEALGGALEAQVLVGSGSPITGILNTASVAAADPPAGATPTERRVNLYRALRAMKRALRENAAVRGKLGWFISPGLEELLGDVEKWATTGQPILDDDTARMLGFPTYVSNRVPTTADASLSTHIILGNWEDVVVGHWGMLEFDVDKSRGFAKGNRDLRVMMECDAAVRRPDSFVVMDLDLADF